MHCRTLLLSIALLLSACANPLNRVTSDNYAETCAVAEQNGQLGVAEQACYRALVNVDMGNLGPELKSQRLYNLARIKKRLSKFVEAEELLKASIPIEQSLSGSTSLQMGRRLVELAASLAGQEKWQEGAEFLIRAAPIAPSYSGSERAYAKGIFGIFAAKLRAMGQPEVAARFEAVSVAL